MKQLLLAPALLLAITTGFAQPIPQNSMDDNVLGWMKVYNFKGAKEPLKVDGKVYSIAQLSVCDSFANWIQATFQPKGGLGDVKRMVSPKLTPYNKHTEARPQMYGAYAKIYTELKRNPDGKLAPFTNSHLLFEVLANYAPGHGDMHLSTPAQYYFLMPTFDQFGFGDPTDKARDLSSLSRYGTYYVRNSVTGNQRMIFLFKDGKSPFVNITKGEYIQATEAAVLKLYETEKKKIHEDKSNDQRDIDYFMKYLNDYHAKRLACLKNNKEKYKDRLQEPAEIFTTEPSLLLENFPDIFEGNGNSGMKVPVYKVDPAVAELCKTDKPQWIVIAWTADLLSAPDRHLDNAVINNFNFDYVYNFFFYPEKVKGQPYRPVR